MCMTPYQLALRTGRPVWELEDAREAMTDAQWDAYCEETMLACCWLED